MNTNDIQKILQEQREISPIKGLTPAEINRKLGNESKRKIPITDHEKIMYEYWSIDKIRPVRLVDIIAERYDVIPNVITKIVCNFYKTLPAKEYKKLRTAYENKYDRSDLIKQIHAEGLRDNKQAGQNISQSKQTLTDEQAIEVYNKCLPWKNKKGAKAFQEQIAKEYGVSHNKIRMTALGYHPALNGSRDGVKRNPL